MRRYDELIEVRRGLVCGQDTPAQFIWRGKLWLVRDVISHWVETGAWWEADETPTRADLLREREFWRVEAKPGRTAPDSGVFDVCFDWALGQWRLAGCID